MKSVVLIDVKRPDDVGVVEDGRGPRLALKAQQQGRVGGLSPGKELDRYQTSHDTVLAEEDVPHAAGADGLQQVILANAEAAPASLEDLVSLERSKQSIADQAVRQQGWVLGQRGTGVRRGKMNLQSSRIEHATFAQQLQKRVGRPRRHLKSLSRTTPTAVPARHRIGRKVVSEWTRSPGSRSPAKARVD
jgi:hypothetical protein